MGIIAMAGYVSFLCKFGILTECRHAPNVTLNCTDGSARVNWVASIPHCQFDCRVLWSCTNMTDYHQEMVTSYVLDFLSSWLVSMSYRLSTMLN